MSSITPRSNYDPGIVRIRGFATVHFLRPHNRCIHCNFENHILARGRKIIVPFLGFFEILIWLVTIGQIFKHMNNPVSYVAYAGGFAAGSYFGILIESKIALGMQVVRIILKKEAEDLTADLKSAGFGSTVVSGEGSTGPVKIVFTILKRRDLPRLLDLLRTDYPEAFFSVEDVRMVEEGIFPQSRFNSRRNIWSRFFAYRKSK